MSLFFATVCLLGADKARAVVNECTYGNSNDLCNQGAYGDPPDVKGSIIPDDYRDPDEEGSGDNRRQGDADSLSDVSPLWDSGTAFVGTPTGSTGSTSGTMPNTNYLQVSAQKKMDSSVREVANATRPEGPCYRPQALISGVTHILPAGTHLFLGLNWSKGMDPNIASTINTALLAMADGLNQWFGSQPATTLKGQTMSDMTPGATPLNYHFQIYSSLDEAKSAAASDSSPSKLVVPVLDTNWADKGGKITLAATEFKTTSGQISSAQLDFNMNFINFMNNILDEKKISSVVKQIIISKMVLDTILHQAGPHEIGHVIGAEHIVFGQPVDDDDSPLVYGGIRSGNAVGKDNFSPPFSACDAVVFNANR